MKLFSVKKDIFFARDPMFFQIVPLGANVVVVAMGVAVKIAVLVVV